MPQNEQNERATKHAKKSVRMGARRRAIPRAQMQVGAPKLVERSQMDERRDVRMLA